LGTPRFTKPIQGNNERARLNGVQNTFPFTIEDLLYILVAQRLIEALLFDLYNLKATITAHPLAVLLEP
jgi:hypothetical protein